MTFRLHSSALALALGLATSVTSGHARAETPAGCDEATLREQARAAKRWRYWWTGINFGLMAGSFATVPLVDRPSRPDWIVAGVGSGIAVLTTWIWPLRVESAPDELDALPATERPRALARLLRESAEDERDRMRWPWHLANLGLSAAAGGVIAFGYKHYASGAITAGISAALGEVQLFTQPTGLPLGCPVVCRVSPSLAWFSQREGGRAFVLSAAGAF
jgi:hypothetical protein